MIFEILEINVSDFFFIFVFRKRRLKKLHLLKFNPITNYYYFDNIVDQQKANQLNLITIARAIRYIFSDVSRHENFSCNFFSWKLLVRLVETLIDTGHEKCLDILVKYNYLGVSDDLMSTFFEWFVVLI